MKCNYVSKIIFQLEEITLPPRYGAGKSYFVNPLLETRSEHTDKCYQFYWHRANGRSNLTHDRGSIERLTVETILFDSIYIPFEIT